MLRPCKRASERHDADGKRRKEGEVVKNDNFGEHDYLSRLNNDCLVDVLKQLPRRDLHNMSKASRKMHAMANDPRLAHIKWEGCSLLMHQTKEGHGFHLFVPDKEEYLAYRCAKTRRGERKFMDTSLSFVDGHPYECHMYRHCHYMIVPSCIFASLGQLFYHHTISVLEFRKVRLNSPFLARLSETLSGKTIVELNLLDAYCSAFTEDDRTSLTRIIIDAKVRKLRVGFSLYLNGLYNDDFFRMVASNLELFHQNERTKLVGNFLISRETMFMLKNLKYFCSKSVIMDGFWVADFAMMYLNNIYDVESCEREFELCADREMTRALLSRDITPEFEFFAVEGNDWNGGLDRFLIVKKSNQLCAQICLNLRIRFAHRDKLRICSRMFKKY
ncbi:hypothetical protein PMAYCL1PPCAC_05982 [Pristionchus mayeri]|uniref:F-box domain-containing protein n=1 Tax=Pristionchus mayeri TaxID=1317129 RepID=A0AAN4ZDJ9_9BILA|nr:hypothetical protein PMAYCL1PPCAC_05982 [Pristionchus mayeri]